MRGGKWELADYVGSRSEQAKEERARSREKGEFWDKSLGDYSAFPFAWSEPIAERKTRYEIIGVERWLKSHALRVLEAKRRNGDSSPVIVVDFGGMFGMSFARLALDMQDMVRRGDVVFVVTNLGFSPWKGLELIGAGYDKIAAEEVELVQRVLQENLVHYVQADASELRQKSVKLPDGTKLPLQGHIDILHEKTALAHGSKNDVDLPLLARSLSDYGTLWFGSTELHARFDISEDSETVRGRAHELGKANLQREGLQQRHISGVKNVRYEMYFKPQAPAVESPKSS